MTTETITNIRPRPQADPACIPRWVFHRGPEEATVEHFDAPASPLRRHAEIASRLRDNGWIAQCGVRH